MNKFLFFMALIVLPCSLSGQKVYGKITDDLGSALPQALIYTSDQHSHSDNFGSFELNNISIGDTIIVKYLGYEEYVKEISADDMKSALRIALEPKDFALNQVNISNALKSTNVIASIDLAINPVSSSQEVMRRVPGVLIGQHAGGGKAEQIFLRGFDIDHGTDIALSVDGIPVNLVSHAHGQGYADMHFIIPETIDKIDFGKGPYYTDKGNFNTAGYIDFETKDELDNSQINLEYGRFNTARYLGMFDLLKSSENQSAYIATEFQRSDGPFESPQNFNRLNVMAKYNIDLNNGDRLSVLFSKMQSRWEASGQIPQRLVDDGTITRFGAVDDTEGGNTSRTNIAIDHSTLINDHLFLKTNAFYSKYDFELFSNFTFFLEDPENGDQIRQYEDRDIYGFNTGLFQTVKYDVFDLELSYHLGLRYDDVNENTLARTANRKTTLENLAFGDVDETNANAGINAEFDFGEWLVNTGLRLDHFNYQYENRLSQAYNVQSVGKGIVSPNLSVIYNPSPRWQFYLKSGKGFHSNDSRVVIDGSSAVVLPSAYGADLGTIFKPNEKLWVNAAAWYLFLEQEFVYVGDAGIVEPSGKTERKGIDLSLRYQLLPKVFFNADVTYTDAVATEESEGNNFIPLAVDLMSAGGISIKDWNRFSGGLRYRYVKDRPANEDNSIIAEGYFVNDLNVNYSYKKLVFGFVIENLFNVDWNEAQFATESQLLNESESVEELHFTPGVPFFVKSSISYKF